jgi:hypothetical protein
VRSLSLTEKSEIKLSISDTAARAKLFFRKYPTNDPFQVVHFAYGVKPVHSFIMNKIFKIYEEKGFFADVPSQPSAGKLEYFFEIKDKESEKTYFKEQPVIIRFKGGVPAAILVPHIIIMFIAMFFANLAGVMALFKYRKFRIFTVWTLILLGIGGMILGPWVQYHAFGEAWTGIPFAWDLTDNKTLIAFLFWILAVVMNRKKERPGYVIAASLVMLAVYSIPHSMFGSQLDPETGKIIQGYIQGFLFR